MKLEVVSLQANHLQLHRDLNLEATTSRHGDNKICFFFRENPYNVSSNLSLSRAHFGKVHVFCMFKFMEVVLEVVEVMEVVHYLYIAAQI